MPAYLVKVTTKSGLVKPPMVVNCADQEEAKRLLTARSDEGDVIEVKGHLPADMKVAFGNVPEGSAVFRFDWIWPSDGDEPRPY